MTPEVAEIEKMQQRLAEIKALVEKNSAVREADGCYDDELLAECMSVLEYATYHDGRYGQDQSWEKFQSPAQKLVQRLSKRLNRKAYEGFGS
jgi:hypothetical protein